MTNASPKVSVPIGSDQLMLIERERRICPALPTFASQCAYGGPMLLFSAPHPWAPDRRLRPVNAAWVCPFPPRSRNGASPGGPAIPMTADQLGPLLAAEAAELWFCESRDPAGATQRAVPVRPGSITSISACGRSIAADGGRGHMRMLLAALSRQLPAGPISLRCSSLFSSSNQIPQCARPCLKRSRPCQFGMGTDSATVPAGAAHRSTTGRPGEVPNLGLAWQSRRGGAIQGWLGHRSITNLYGPGAEPVQGFLAGVRRMIRSMRSTLSFRRMKSRAAWTAPGAIILSLKHQPRDPS
jgi:hypothetical protein